ncbi:MAG: hypothetical protein FWD65_00855 [Coriobacteriia bacterium]|nr:hypothetical protein [Coriobacteriia bacterium]
MIKRIAAGILGMLCLLLLTAPLAGAADLKPSNLTVIMTYNGAPLKGLEVALSRVADATLQQNGTVTFSSVQAFSGAGADFSDLGDAANVALAARLDTYAVSHGIAYNEKLTDSAGKVTYNALPAGLYLVEQKDSKKSGYVMAPYLVMVPSADSSNALNYEVTSYPKTELTKITVPTTPTTTTPTPNKKVKPKPTPGPGTTPGSSSAQTASTTPKTGDNTLLPWRIVGIITGSAGLLGVAYSLDRRRRDHLSVHNAGM